jgi:TrmH family RNA methyltransferase
VLLEGPRVVREAVAAGVQLEVLALAEESGFQAPAQRTVILGRRALDSLSQTVTPQGVLAIAHRETVDPGAALSAARGAGWPLIVLDGVQDPGNVGTICRSAAAAGAPALAVLDGSADPFGPKAIRASAGCVFRLFLARATWADLEGVHGYGASAGGGVPLREAELERAQLLALGGEVRGLRRTDLDPVTIPMASGVESLNVGAAAAILLFEVRRRRDQPRGTPKETAAAEGAA